MAAVEFWVGPAGSGKTSAAITEFAQAAASARARGRLETLLWIAPDPRAAREARRRLTTAIDSEAVLLGAEVTTFEMFAEQILELSGEAVVPVSRAVQRRLLANIVREGAQSGRLKHFGPIAASFGLLDLATSLIAELKRLEAWPEDFEQRLRESGPGAAKDRELHWIYQRYQEELARRSWYDSAGRFWLARSAMARRAESPLPELSLVVVEGFADFSHTQYEMIGLLAGWAQRVVVTFPGDTRDDRRADLFAVPLDARQALSRQLPQGTPARLRRFESPRFQPAGFDALARDLFSHPRSIVPANASTGIEIVASMGRRGEAQQIGLRIKRWLIAGVPADQILVGLRDADRDGPGLAEEWRSAGIPLAFEPNVQLADAPLIRRLFSLFRAEADDWAFARLEAAWGANGLAPQGLPAHWDASRRAAMLFLRRYKLARGRASILDAARRIAARSETTISESANDGEDAPLDQDARDASEVRLGARVIDLLGRITARIARKQAWTEWVEATTRIATELGLAPAADQQNFGEPDDRLDAFAGRLSELRRREIDDWKLFQASLRSVLDVESVDRAIDVGTFLAELADMLRHVPCPARVEPAGCVRLTSWDQLRHLSAPHVVLLGVTEQAIPRGRGDDCLYSEAERAEFSRRGLPLLHAASQSSQELLLFYSLVTRATERLVLSYASVDFKGQAAYPSPYVASVLSLFEPGALAIRQEGSLNPFPAASEAMTPRDARLAAVKAARHGDPAPLRWLFDLPPVRGAARNYLASTTSAVARFHTRGFTRFEGQLESATNLRELGAKFGPLREFSATQLERYASCPFRFWMESVLGAIPPVDPEVSENHQSRGSLVHEIAADLLRELGVAPAADVVHERFASLLSERLAERPCWTDLDRALVRVERATLLEWAAAFAKQVGEYRRTLHALCDGRWDSLPPELDFGEAAHESGSGSESSGVSLTVGAGDGATRLGGRIDRIDFVRLDDGAGFIVVDYKTGSKKLGFSLDHVLAGKSLQLAVYATAIRRLGLLGPNAEPLQLGYWGVTQNGFVAGLKQRKKGLAKLERATIAELEQAIDEVVPQLAEQIRAGRFLVQSQEKNCTSCCAYRTMCRVNQVRSVADDLDKIDRRLQVRSGDEEPDDE